MSNPSITSAPAAPTTDERLAAVEHLVGRYSGEKDGHVVVSPDRAYKRSM